MHKIYINGRFLTQKITGVQRYAHEIVKNLDYLIASKEIIDMDFEVLMPKHPEISVSYQSINIRQVGFFQGHLWEQLELPVFTKDNLLINLCNAAPMIKSRQIVVIHDVAVFANPFNFSFAFRIWYQVLLKMLTKHSQQIITVSNFSKNELQKYCPKTLNEIRVIYEGAEQFKNIQEDNTILKRFDLLDTPYILAVSSISPNKNFKAIINALGYLNNCDVEVVIAGAINNKIFRHSSYGDIPDYIKCVGYVTDEQLKSLYMNASCFVYPSLYEGFGLPPLEAMICGCPVIASNAASIPEVCGNAALYCDPYNAEDIAEKIQLLVNDTTLRKNLSLKGLGQARKFSWKKCANETMLIIEKTLSL